MKNYRLVFGMGHAFSDREMGRFEYLMGEYFYANLSDFHSLTEKWPHATLVYELSLDKRVVLKGIDDVGRREAGEIMHRAGHLNLLVIVDLDEYLKLGAYMY